MKIFAYALVLAMAASHPLELRSQESYYYYFDSKIYLTEVKGEYAVRFDESLSEARRKDIIEAMKVRRFGTVKLGGGFMLVNDEMNRQDIISSLRSQPEIKEAMPIFNTVYNIKCMLINQFLVRFKPDMSRGSIESLNSQKGASIVRTSKYRNNLYVLKSTTGNALDALLLANEYHLHPDVEYAEPDLISFSGQLSVTPNDPFFSNQWHLDKIGALKRGDK